MSSNDEILEPDIVVISELTGPGRKIIEPELGDPEYAALGKVTAQWAYLEHAMFVRTLQVADEVGQALPEEAEHLSFKRRFRAFRGLVEQNKETLPSADQLLKIADRIANLMDDRHRVTHGIWSFKRGQARTIVASSFRPKVNFERPFNIDRIWELSRRIGHVNFDLTFPDGNWTIGREGDGEFVGAVSRAFQLSKEDRARIYPELSNPIPADPPKTHEDR